MPMTLSHISAKDFRNLKHADWVEVCWEDSDNNVALVVGNSRVRGEVQLYFPESDNLSGWYEIHQIVRKLDDKLVVPVLK